MSTKVCHILLETFRLTENLKDFLCHFHPFCWQYEYFFVANPDYICLWLWLNIGIYCFVDASTSLPCLFSALSCQYSWIACVASDSSPVYVCVCYRLVHHFTSLCMDVSSYLFSCNKSHIHQQLHSKYCLFEFKFIY